MPVTCTASPGRPGTWTTEPISARSVRAVSSVTAASTRAVEAVTSAPVARGSRPERSRAWSARALGAARTICAGTPSGRGSHASRTGSGEVVRTPYADRDPSTTRGRSTVATIDA